MGLVTGMAIEWYPELQRLSAQIHKHLLRQLRPDSVLGRRIGDRGGYTFNDDAHVLHANIGNKRESRRVGRGGVLGAGVGAGRCAGHVGAAGTGDGTRSPTSLGRLTWCLSTL